MNHTKQNSSVIPFTRHGLPMAQVVDLGADAAINALHAVQLQKAIENLFTTMASGKAVAMHDMRKLHSYATEHAIQTEALMDALN
jgi:hypothetical protein